MKSLLVATVVFSFLAAGAQTAAAQKDSGAKAVAPGPPVAVQANDPDYVIGPEDMLHINVWKEADITSTVPVRPDGKISLPLLNDVQAAGLTAAALRASLTEKLKAFIADPQVTVVVSAVNSKRIFVIGEVARPGAMQLIPGMTVLQAITSAGGLTPFANAKKIHVIRSVHGSQEKLTFNYKEAIKGDRPDVDYPLLPGDSIIVR